MSPSCTPLGRRSWRRRRRRAFSNSYYLLLCALPCPACTLGRKKKKTWLGSLIATVPQPPFPPYALNFPFFLSRTYFFFSFPLPCSFLDLSEEIRRRRDARNSAMSNISKREWKVGCPKIYSKSMIESCLWYHLGWQVDPLFHLNDIDRSDRQ